MRTWYFMRGEQSWGPLNDEEARTAIERGQVFVSDLVCEGGTDQWLHVGQHPVLAPLATPPTPTTGSSHEPWPLSKKAIMVLNILVSPLAGAILYHAWKSQHPEAARFANRTSLAVFGLGIMAAGTICCLWVVAIPSQTSEISVRCAAVEDDPVVLCVIPTEAVAVSDCGSVRMACQNVPRSQRSQAACIAEAELAEGAYLLELTAPGFYGLLLEAAIANPTVIPQQACEFGFEVR